MSEPNQAKVQVAVRIRPLLDKFGEAFSIKSAKKATDDTVCLTHPVDDSPNSGKQYPYSFNYIFDEDDSQSDLYESVKDLVDSTLDGHNTTIFTYGQTGSGKTHTVLGKVTEKDGHVIIGDQTGLYMRVLNDLLLYKAANSTRSHVVITLSILEIHKEVIKDLLRGGKVLELQRNRYGDDAVPGLKMMEVSTLHECYEVFQIGNSHRSVAPTLMNDASSRSHAVFMIDILQQEKTPDHSPLPPNAEEIYASDFSTEEISEEAVPVKRSRLCLVDLAGSERLKKSGAEGQTLKETQAINASLACLGNVVNALYEGKTFVGYRDSKLTMLLKCSFERANAKVMLITNISPIQESFQESMGSLRFADRIMSLRAKQVFMMDADSEQDYLDSLKTHAELCADLRLAMATYDLKLHGGHRLRRLKNKDGQFSQATVSQLMEEHKKLTEAVQQKKLNQLVSRILSQRSLVDAKAERFTDLQGWQLKVQEQTLLLQAAENEQQAFTGELDAKKHEYKAVHKLTKNLEKIIEELKEVVAEAKKEQLKVEEVANAKQANMLSEESVFASAGELPRDMRPPTPPLQAEPPAQPATTDVPPDRKSVG
eukprot:RCo010036